MRSLKELVRPNILALAPHSIAREQNAGHAAHVFLDANENPYNKPYNRYPDPLQRELKEAIAKVKNVESKQIFLGNGSDEAIDLCYRIFCQPGIDNVVAIEPTYSRYKTYADINDVEYRAVPLDDDFQLNAERLLSACDKQTKLIWICTPNNPTGNNINTKEIEKVLRTFNGIIVIDEAYSDFSRQRTFRERLEEFPNIIVLNTFSNAWGCAAIRLGMAFAQEDIIQFFNKVKQPYNISSLTQEQAIEALRNRFDTDEWVRILLGERNRMLQAFSELPSCVKVYPTDANFFLAHMTDAQATYDYLANQGIIVSNKTQVTLCDNCLRITIGARAENSELLGALRRFK